MKALALVCFAVLLVGLAGCAWMYSAPAPLRTEAAPASPTGRASTLLVLMPGRGDKASAFAEHGFITDLRASGLAFDVVAVDAHIGYYMKETIVERMSTDVLQPARAQYKQIWIVGASMGGLGALIVASRLPGAVDRIFLLSPYLGPNSLMRDIEAAGGPARWMPTDSNDPVPARLALAEAHREPGSPNAADDARVRAAGRMAPNHRLLAQLLPADRVFEVDGKHGWVSWRQLWQRGGKRRSRAVSCRARSEPADETEPELSIADFIGTTVADARSFRTSTHCGYIEAVTSRVMPAACASPSSAAVVRGRRIRLHRSRGRPQHRDEQPPRTLSSPPLPRRPGRSPR